MNCVVLTPEKELFSGSVTSVKVPGSSGHFEILEGHAPIVSSLTEGKVRVITQDGDEKYFEIAMGFVEVLRNEVAVLVTEQESDTEE